MANGIFSGLGLIDPNVILQQSYQQQQAQQPGAFSAPGISGQPDYESIQQYAAQLASERGKRGGGMIPAGSLPSVEGGFEAPVRAFGTVFKSPEQKQYEAAAAEIGARYSQEGRQFGPEYYKELSDKMLSIGNTKGAWMAAQQAGILKAAQAPKQREYAYKAGEIKEMDITLPDGRVGTESFQFWPELANQGYQHSPELPVGFIPAKGTAVPRKEAMKVEVAIGKEVAKEAADLTFKELGQANKEAKAARAGIASINVIEQALEGINTGNLAPVQMALGKAASSFGLKLGDVSSMEAAESAAGNLVMSVLDNFPGAISEGERAYAKSIVPSLTVTPEGRKQVAQFMRAMYERAIEYRKQMDAFRAKSPDGTIYPPGRESFQSQWDEYSSKNPITKVFTPPRRRVDVSQASKAFKDQAGKTWYLIGDKVVNEYGEERK